MSPPTACLCLITLILCSSAQDDNTSGHFCVRSSRGEDGRTRITFLGDDAAGVRSLYLTQWSEDMRLGSCQVNSSPVVVESYSTFCDRSQSQEIPQGFNSSVLLAPDAPCALIPSAPKFRRTRRGGREGRTRRKRAWVFPGTLWCGTGSKAVGYEQLGMFESTDICCREHDHCLQIIPAFTVNYGVFNPNLFTVSHCDCDQRFRQCLLGVNDPISSTVGFSFFNILRVPCFELKLQMWCTETFWWGKCTIIKEAPYAVFKSPQSYNILNVSSNYENDTDSNKSVNTDRQHEPESSVIKLHKKSPKVEQRCSPGDQPRQETLYSPRTKGKGCKRPRKPSTEARFHMPPSSTTPSTKMGLTPYSKSSPSIPNQKRVGKKKGTIKGLLAQGSSQVSTNLYKQTMSATKSSPPLTKRPLVQHHSPTTIATVAKTVDSDQNLLKPCCGSGIPLRGDTLQGHCISCPEQNTTVTPSIIINRPPLKVITAWALNTTPNQDSMTRLWNTAASATSITAKRRTIYKYGERQNEMDPHILRNKTVQEPIAETTAQRTPAERGRTGNNALHDMTDYHPLCKNLKHLDECKLKIPPMERKYDLQNMERKTAYHCDCISRMADQIESFKQPSILPSLLMDFVSQYCFTLPKEKKCRSRKSCSGGFTHASDLLEALKKKEEKDTAGVRNSGNKRKRGIPVRLYKRCLRLEREADIMAQLT